MKKRSHDRAPDKLGFSVALPKRLVAEIESIAQSQHRTRNKQIEHFLDGAVKEWLQQNAATATGFSKEPKARPESNIKAGSDKKAVA